MIPFRITIPEKNMKICRKSGNFCATKDKALLASFSIALNLNIYGYFYADTKVFSSVIKSLFKRKKPKKKNVPRGKGKRFNKKPIRIIPRTGLGCIPLKGILAPLNKYYRGKCCGGKRKGK